MNRIENTISCLPEPKVRLIVHVRLVSMINLAAEQLGECEPGGESPGPGQSDPDDLDGVVGWRRLGHRREQHRGHPHVDRRQEHDTDGVYSV